MTSPASRRAEKSLSSTHNKSVRFQTTQKNTLLLRAFTKHAFFARFSSKRREKSPVPPPPTVVVHRDDDDDSVVVVSSRGKVQHKRAFLLTK